MKKLIILARKEYLRNYQQTNAFGLIDDENCYYAMASGPAAPVVENHKRFVGKFMYSAKDLEAYECFTHVLMLGYRNKCKTFWFRYMRCIEPLVTQWRAGLKHVPKQYLKRIGLYLKVSLLGFTPLFNGYIKNFLKHYPINSELEACIKKAQPDLVIFPTSASEETSVDILRLQEKYHFKTLFLVDNWDNLSSKTVFPIAPSHLCVWGEQSVEHAQSIHNIARENITIIGTPRFQQYETAIEQMKQGDPLASPYKHFDYLLYTGCSIPFDELSSLKLLDDVLVEVNAERERPLKLIYRPHPWRMPRRCDDLFKDSDFKHIMIDEQVKAAYYQNDLGFMPSLNYFPALLTNAKAVVGPLTTMLLEAALFERPIIALAYDDGAHYTSPDRALKYYRHFEGLENIEGWQISRSKQQMIEQFKALIAKVDTDKAVFNTEKAKEQLSYYLYRSNIPYAERLKAVVDRIEAQILGAKEPSTAHD